MLRLARLARWLGPWAGDAVPPGIARTTELLPSGVRIAWYEPARPARSAILVAQGLHYLGADDPRLDRFCRALAAGGALVACPLLSDYLDLHVAPGVVPDFAEGFFALERRASAKPSVFSISFGSLPAIRLAASDDAAARIGKLVLFGGYADFWATIRFAAGGDALHEGEKLEIPRDPLNGPVVIRHVVPFLPGDLERAPLVAAMKRMARRTWGRPELKEGDRRAPHAERIAAELGAPERRVFLASCGLDPELPALRLLEDGLARSDGALAFADVRDALARVRVPTTVVHGRGDDVIPFTESVALARGIPRARLLLTGVYGHTAAALPSAGEAARELGAMIRILRELESL